MATNIVSHNPLPRGAVPIMATLLFALVLCTATVRLSGVSVHEPDAAAVSTRQLRFEDRPDGSVAVLDGRDNSLIETVQGEAGFLRGALRALTRERMKRSLGPAQPFELIGRADGRLTLHDPATGARLDLESFGPTNAGVFVRLMTAGRS